jgi:hypothetical protein
MLIGKFKYITNENHIISFIINENVSLYEKISEPETNTA